MIYSNLCADIGYASLNHVGELLCGDHVELVDRNDGTSVLVLADGLGSGVKASILSTLTSSIISTMMANGMDLEDCVRSVASTLPVCSERNVAYSTFTIMHLQKFETAELIQYDNPHAIMLREGALMSYRKDRIELDEKTIYRSVIPLKSGDTFVFFSDGMLNASEGEELNLDWNLTSISEFVEMVYDPSLSAKSLSTMLLSACNNMYGGKPGDDITVCTVKIRDRERVNVLMGPPEKDSDLELMLDAFFAQKGMRIVCGGTTSKLAAAYLGTEVDESMPLIIDPEIPPIAAIPGVELVTEGVITMTRVLEYAKDFVEDNKRSDEWSFKKDGASLIAKILFDKATDICFYIGRAMNSAHQNPNLPVSFNMKMRIVEELSACLKKMGKRVEVNYF